ncbi:MAG TPA: hypothetical protein VKT77_20060, partial [Chthonomonadaceae bacterium]|nr:hypothetical protein [Chthonomonadaceae bacterium]
DAVTAEAGRLAARGSSVLFLVDNDPIYYMASGARSEFRYSPLFQSLLTRGLESDTERKFLARRIDYVVMPPLDPFRPDGELAWDARVSLWRVVTRCYALDHRCGAYEVWRRL